MTRTHRRATSVVFTTLISFLLLLLLGPRQAASMCQCGIYVLWENNRVGEEVLLGDPMRGRCRVPQEVNTRLEERCRTYCSTRSELLTNGGNLAVMGTFLSMATKFYACQMLHTLHQDPNGYHTHLGQSRVESFWVGSFYRYCRNDWKFAGRESIRQVCCQRNDFLVCPPGVRNDSPPDFKLPDPPTTQPPLPVKAAKEEPTSEAPPSEEVMKAALQLVIKMMGEANAATPATNTSTESGSPSSQNGITPAQEALMGLFAKNGGNETQPLPLQPLQGSQGSSPQQTTAIVAVPRPQQVSNNQQVMQRPPEANRNQQQFTRGLSAGGNQFPGSTRLQPSTALIAPVNSPPVRPNPSVIVTRTPGAQQNVQFFSGATGTRNTAQMPFLQGQTAANIQRPIQVRPAVPTTHAKGSLIPRPVRQPSANTVAAAGKDVTASKGFISLTQPAQQVLPMSNNSWTPMYSPAAAQQTTASYHHHAGYQVATPSPVGHYPVYPPVVDHYSSSHQHYKSGMHNKAGPAHQYFASRMDAASGAGEASLHQLAAPLPQLPPESGLQISSSSLLDELGPSAGGSNTFSSSMLSNSIAGSNFGSDVMNVNGGSNVDDLDVWALDKFDPIILEAEATKQTQANQEGSRFLIAPPTRPRPSFPFRPHSHNTSSLAYVDFSLGLMDAFLAEMGVPTIGRIMEEMNYPRTELQDDIQRMESVKDFVRHEVNLGYCYAEFLFFDLFKNRNTYGFTFFGSPNNAGRRRGDQDDPFKDSFFLAFWRFLGRMRREGVATPIVSFLRRAVKNVASGAKRLLWRRHKRHRRRTARSSDQERFSAENSTDPSFLRVLGRTLATVLTDESRIKRSLTRHRRHAGDDEAAVAATRDALSSNLRPFAVGPLSTFLDYLMRSNDPNSSYYCLKNYVSSKLYFWLGKGLKSFLFT